jgi:hypothetical protein
MEERYAQIRCVSGCTEVRMTEISDPAVRRGNTVGGRLSAEDFSDFTENGYRTCLRLAKNSYSFIGFRDAGPLKSILWRHDCDGSIHRAARLAEIEAEEGVRTTYFLFPRCLYYNLLSADISACVRHILDLGHEIGLHFDPTFYDETLDGTALVQAIERERDLLANEFGSHPTSVSFHLYGVLKSPMPEDDMIAGMVNAYGKSLKANYGYVSDSNGVWRFRRLRTVLEEAKEERLQVLTHPEWWTPEAMPPRARLQRAIDGYASAMGRWYDEITAKHGRPNIR